MDLTQLVLLLLLLAVAIAAAFFYLRRRRSQVALDATTTPVESSRTPPVYAEDAGMASSAGDRSVPADPER